LLTLNRRRATAVSFAPDADSSGGKRPQNNPAAARFVVAETRGSNQEFAVDRCDRHRAFAIVFLALFGLLFFVSPAGAQLTTIFN